MKKIGPAAAVFLTAYFLSKILLSIFNLTGFRLDEPNLLALILELFFWAAAWAVSYIVYKTLRDGIKEKLEEKRAEQKEGESYEVS